jgi:hypothetical protein
MEQPLAPPQSVLDAFNIHHSPQPLSGGRGLCFFAGDVVLRPVDETTEAEWLGDLLLKLSNLSSPEYRVSRPLLPGTASLSPPHRFITNGWTASSFLSGKDGPKNKWSQLFNASRAFHRDLKELVQEPPAFIGSRTHRWAQADRITWEEQRLEDTLEVNYSVLERISGYLARLERFKKPLSKDNLACQLIHADLTGNVLFDVENQALSPAIIDLSLHWRPVEFAEAIVVADGITWFGEGPELIRLFGTDSFRLQILVRALYWRILTFAIQSDLPWLEAHLPSMDFDQAVRLVSECFASTC